MSGAFLVLIVLAPVDCDSNGEVSLCHTEAVEGALLVTEVSGCGTVAPRLRAFELDRPTFPIGGGRFHGLLPVPLDAQSGAHLLEVRCGAQRHAFVLRVERADYETSELRVAKRFTNPPPPRTRDESRAISEAWSLGANERLWSEPFVKPVDDKITSPFGTRRVFNEALQSQHRGIDIDGFNGVPVRAANDGVVVLAAKDYYFVGNAVLLDHGAGLFTAYFHFRSLAVKTGDRVARGQVLGLMGETGRVTGPHLHFAVKLDGSYVNPTHLLDYRQSPLCGDRGCAIDRE